MDDVVDGPHGPQFEQEIAAKYVFDQFLKNFSPRSLETTLAI